MISNKFIDKMNEYGRQNLPFLFIISFDANLGIVIKLDEIDNNEILFDIDGIKNNTDERTVENILIKKYPEDYRVYLNKFDKITKHLKYGNSYLINLTSKTKIETTSTLQEIFHSSKARYKLFIKDKFVCFSPECFVNINNNEISTYPMKGTISNKIDNALKVIMDDEKEKQEHNTIVDLLRNDLSIVAEDVRVTNFRFPTYVKTNDYDLIQISSEIKGKLPNEYANSIGDLFAKLLPAGSVTGAPKKRTIEIIKEVEEYERGFYTGVFGVFINGNVKSSVLIRFIELYENNLYFKSGGGITINSEPHSEYQEMIDKIYVPIA